jgi:hypothetical protein
MSACPSSEVWRQRPWSTQSTASALHPACGALLRSPPALPTPSWYTALPQHLVDHIAVWFPALLHPDVARAMAPYSNLHTVPALVQRALHTQRLVAPWFIDALERLARGMAGPGAVHALAWTGCAAASLVLLQDERVYTLPLAGTLIRGSSGGAGVYVVEGARPGRHTRALPLDPPMSLQCDLYAVRCGVAAMLTHAECGEVWLQYPVLARGASACLVREEAWPTPPPTTALAVWLAGASPVQQPGRQRPRAV